MTSFQINRSNLVDQLRIAFPELERGYEDQLQEYKGKGEPSSYEVVGYLLQPRLKEALEKSEEGEFLVRAARFLERVCTSGDLEALNVVWIEIFEWLMQRPDDLRVLWPFLGNSTRSAVKDAAERWGQAHNLPV
jgi:hypothetical protein